MVDLINAIKDRLAATPGIAHVAVFNNQVDNIEDGGTYSHSLPAAFPELITSDPGQLCGGYQSHEIELRVHLVNDIYNSGYMDQNMEIFALRDAVVRSFWGFKTPQTGHFLKVDEIQDHNHTNVYHYIITFKFHYIDSTTVQTQYYTTPPTNWQQN